MKQFFVFILTAFGVAIFDLIDSAFGNNLGIDSICVLSAFTIILWCAKVLGSLGKYAYDIRQKNFSECLLLQLLSSGATSIFILIFCNKLPYIYHLTDRQYMLFTKCLFWFALVFPLRQIANFCDNYVVLHCKNRTLIISNVIYYALMIGLDLLVVIMGGKCYHLIITTDISYIVFFIYLWFAEKFWKQLNKIDKKALKECCLEAKDILIDRCLGKIATLVFNVLASYLGTELYALHGIGYAIATTSEEITNAWYRYQIIRLHGIESKKEKYRNYLKVRKQTFLPSVFLSYSLLLCLIVPMHGETNLLQAFIVSCLYMTQCILLCIYENARGFLTSIGETKILRYGGLIGIVIRVPWSFLSIYTPLGIVGFALGSGIDFLIRGIYYAIECKKYVE